jgi:hypothetical protein
MLINYVHVEPSGNKVHFFSQIDLSSLLSRVNWQATHTISSISQVFEADFSRDFTWSSQQSSEMNQARLRDEVGEPFNYFSIEGSRRAPSRLKSNLKLIDVMVFSKETNTFEEFQSVLDMNTKQVNLEEKFEPKTFPIPAFYPNKNVSNAIMIKYDGEPDSDWIKEGIYIDGKELI